MNLIIGTLCKRLNDDGVDTNIHIKGIIKKLKNNKINFKPLHFRPPE